MGSGTTLLFVGIDELICLINLLGTHLGTDCFWSRTQAEPRPQMRTGSAPCQLLVRGSRHITIGGAVSGEGCQWRSAAE